MSDETTPASEEPAVGKKAGLGMFLSSSLFLCLLLLGAHALLTSSWDGRVEARVAELEAEGIGVDGLYPDPPTPNGADDLMKAHDQIGQFPDDVEIMLGARASLVHEVHTDPESENRGIVYEPLAPTSPKTLEAAGKLVIERVDAAEALIDRGLAIRVVHRAEWEKGFEAELPHLMPMKRLHQVLEVRANWAMIRGQPKLAYADLIRSLKVALTLREPSLITRLVQIAIVGGALFELEDFLSMGPPPAGKQAATLRELLVALEEIGGLTPSLRGELYAFLHIPDDPRAILGNDANGASKAAASLMWGKWRAEHVELLSQTIRASTKSKAELDAHLEELEQKLRGGGGIGNPISAMLYPSIHAIRKKEATHRARLRLAIAALDLAQMGELPQNYGRMPKDPWREKGPPCRYKREGLGALLWSVGPDGVDSGGQTAPPGEEGPDDVTFRLLRKGPAAPR